MSNRTVIQSSGGSESPTQTDEQRRAELILRQIDSLPALPVVATRLLSPTSQEQTSAQEVIDLVSADQSLTTRVLSLCRHADLRVRNDALTVERAVVLLGFKAIRNAVLSVKVLQLFSEESQKEDTYDKNEFWRHCLGTAICAELIATAHPELTDLNPQEAFVCGLLHDIGKLALDYVMPKSYRRIVELTELHRGNIAEFERRIVGLDHHMAGKRLAEHWQLPFTLHDCIWLHGSAYNDLPQLNHRHMIGLVSLSDLLVRRFHIGYSGNLILDQDEAELTAQLQLDPARINSITQKLHESVQRRYQLLGLDDIPSAELFMRSIGQANEAISRMNAALDRRSRISDRQSHILKAIAKFNAEAVPGHGIQEVVDKVVASATPILKAEFYVLLCQPDSIGGIGGGDGEWLLCQYDRQGQRLDRKCAEAPDMFDWSGFDVNQPVSTNLMERLPWITKYLSQPVITRQFRSLPLSYGRTTAAILLHDHPTSPSRSEIQALTSIWGSAIASASQHDGARKLGEELTEVNRTLTKTHDRLLRCESLVRLGEMAAGATHEMNPPLAIISGQSELLAKQFGTNSKERAAAKMILTQAHRLSDLITSMHLFADPPKANRQATDMADLLNKLTDSVHTHLEPNTWIPPIVLYCKSAETVVSIDPEQIRRVIRELMINAVQAPQCSNVQVTVRINTHAKILLIEVLDDGQGMDGYVLAHAMDPFFSAEAASRRVGLGLTRAKQLAAAHHGQLSLQSSPGKGTQATLAIPLLDETRNDANTVT